MAKTLSEKVWQRHIVRSAPGEPDLLYIDLHLVHEVTSPQAFDGVRLAGRGGGPPGGGGARPPLTRPAPRPRGAEPAGVRRVAPGGARRAPPRADGGDGGPQRAD